MSMSPTPFAFKAWVPACAGWVLGTAAQLQQQTLASMPSYAAGLAAALAAAAALRWAWSRTSDRPASRAWRIAAAALVAAAAAFSATGWRATAFDAQRLSPALEGRDVQIQGVIAAMPQPGELGTRFRFEVDAAQSQGQAVAIPPLLLLGWYAGAAGPPPDLRPGQRWQFTVRLKAPHGNLNPFGFDYELWLWEQGLQATGYVRTGAGDMPHLMAQGWAHPVEQARHAVRSALYQQLPDDARTAGILAALVVGDQAAIERADWDVFRATGVAHLMSISGLHITAFAWVAAAVLGALWRRQPRLCLAWPAQHVALVGGVLLAAAYALFSGWGVPAQRTVCMLATVGLLRWAGLQWPWHAVWLSACAVVVAFDPWAMMQAGFWLSFVAVGVLFATSAPQAAGPAGWRARLAALWHEQLTVTLALTPLSLLLFGQVSVVGFAANLLAIPWVTLVVTPLALAGVLLAPLWGWAAWAVQLLAAALQQMAAWPGATVSVAAAPLWAGVAGVVGGLLLALRWPLSLRVLGVPLLLPVLLWQAARPAAGEFELLAADIGQGNAVLVRTAGHTLLYDTGPRYSSESDAGHRVLLPLLRALDERLDRVVVSHRDSDHSGGAPAVLSMQRQAGLLSSVEPTHPLWSLRPGQRCEAGQRWQWDGVDFQVLHPLAADYDVATRPNALSCVLRVANGRQTALLVGDIEQPQEAALLQRADAALKAHWLLVPHHGSRTSSSPAFLDAVAPSVALVQAGHRNRYGHPVAEVMARYAERGITVVESVRCGAATWRSQNAALACERHNQARYWHHTLAP